MPDKPQIVPGELRTVKMVLTEPVPPAMAVCTAPMRADAAAALKAKYDEGTELPSELNSTYSAHLVYCAELGDAFYEAGFSADFSEILFVYRNNDMEESKKLLEGDPFYKAGIIHDPQFIDWEPHAPLYKCSMPPMPEQVLEVEVDQPTPRTLIAAFGDADFAPIMQWTMGKGPRPIAQLLHLNYKDAEGSLGFNGIEWLAGPNAGFPKTLLHVYNVPDVATAKHYNEMDAMYRWGMMNNFRYFEWCIHYPLRKAAPKHKETLRQAMIDAGQQL